MQYRTERYTRRGILAIAPSALFTEFLVCEEPARENTEVGDAVVVHIRGPLEQHSHPWCDSYESITARVAAACATGARTVCLRIDSPGGDVAGCFDAAPQLRAMAAAAGKRLVAWIDGECCSAAYALACSADRIVSSVTSLVGSIGVLSAREDITAMNAARGLRVELIKSGARKADGHPHEPISEAELANTQAIVNSMASVFFDLVASARRLTPEQIAQQDARVFHGAAAVTAGLIDAVGPIATALAEASAPTAGAGMATPFEEAVEKLKEAAEGEDANAAVAKKMLQELQQLGAEEDEEEEPPPSETAERQEEKPAAASSGGDRAEAAYRLALKAEKRAAAAEHELARLREADERRELIGSRSDLSPDMKALLQKAPMALVRETIEGMQPPKKVAAAAQAATAAATRGAGQGDGNASHLPEEEQHNGDWSKPKLDREMGLSATSMGVRSTDYKLELGVQLPRAKPQPGGTESKN